MKSVVWIALVVALMSAGHLPASAETAIPRVETPSSTNESPGCSALDGTRGPYASVAGNLSDREPLWGPWGEFWGRTIGDVRADLVHVHLPNTVGHKHIYLHERVVPAFEAALANLDREARRGNVYRIYASQTFSFNPRTVPPRRHISFHSVGAAVDINSLSNPYRGDGLLITNMPSWFVDAWKDAGWCWGGDWQEIKDPMHFSWRGWGVDPTYPDPGPHPPATGRGDFSDSVRITSRLHPIAPDDAMTVLGDINRDGAADLVRIATATEAGHLRLETATSHHGFETCVVSKVGTRIPRQGQRHVLLGDLTGLEGRSHRGDGRDDLVVVAEMSGGTRIEAFSPQDFYEKRRLTASSGMALPNLLRLGDLDRDGTDDFWAVTDDMLEVWSGPTAATRLGRWDLAGAPPTDIAVGDRTGDGVPDLIVATSSGRVRVHDASDGFAVTEVRSIPLSGRLEVADYDGDGHLDVWDVTVTAATIHLGGQRSTTAGLDYWFKEHDRHHTPGVGCSPAAPAAPFAGVAAVSAADATVVWTRSVGDLGADAEPDATAPVPDWQAGTSTDDGVALITGGRLRIYDGTTERSFPIGPGTPIDVAAAADRIVVAVERTDSTVAVRSYDLDGTPLGSFGVDAADQVVVVGDETAVIAAGTITWHDAAGAELARRRVPASVAEAGSLADGTTWVVGGNTLKVITFDTSHERATTRRVGVSGGVVSAASDGDLVVVGRRTRAGKPKLHGIGADGTQRWVRAMPVIHSPVAVAVGGGRVLVVGVGMWDGSIGLQLRSMADGALLDAHRTDHPASLKDLCEDPSKETRYNSDHPCPGTGRF